MNIIYIELLLHVGAGLVELFHVGAAFIKLGRACVSIDHLALRPTSFSRPLRRSFMYFSERVMLRKSVSSCASWASCSVMRFIVNVYCLSILSDL